PLQRVQGHEFPGTTRDVYDFRECDTMVSLLRDLEYMAIDPSRGADKDGKSRRRPLGLHLLERAIDNALSDAVHPVREKRDRERFRFAHVRQGATVLGQGERDQ